MLVRGIPALVVLFTAHATTLGQEPKSPLRFVPAESEFVLKIDRPRELYQAVTRHELFQKALRLPGYRDLYDSTNVERLNQLVAYFEKQLAQTRQEIADEVTAGGMVLAAKLTDSKSGMVIVQAKDARALSRFMEVALDLAAKELERQESKDRIERGKHQQFDIFKVGKELAFATADGALLLANNETVLKTALDQQGQGRSILKVNTFANAHARAPMKALAWGWVHLEALRGHKPFAAGLESASLDPLQTILYGGLTSVLKRAPYVAGVLRRDGEDFRIALHLPAGIEGMGPLAQVMLPADERGTFAPLQPPRTIASSSYFLDLGKFWDRRVEVLGEKNAAGLTEGEKNIQKVLGGLKLGKLLQSAGPHQRLVFAQQKQTPYKTKPGTPFPAFALIFDVRDPSFAKDMNTIFRSAALLATFQYGLALKEETHQDCEMISYHFSEARKVEGDPDGIRFNFTPTYVTVGDHFIISATSELARDLIDALKAEKAPTSSRSTMRTRFYASGLNEVIRANEDAALTKLILTQAVPPATAKADLRAFMEWIDQLGLLHLEATYGPTDFRYDIIWQTKRK